MAFYAAKIPLQINEDAGKLLTNEARTLLAGLREAIIGIDNWTPEVAEHLVRSHADANGAKLGAVAQPLRAALTGSKTSPGIFEILAILGPDEAARRITSIC